MKYFEISNNFTSCSRDESGTKPKPRNNNDNVCNMLYLKEGIKHEKATPHVIEPMS